MYTEFTYGAPWGTALKGLTAFSVLVLALVAATGVFTGPQALWVWRASMVWTPTLVLVMGLRLPNRTIVVTPDRPVAFVADIRERLGLDEAGWQLPGQADRVRA